ncbi:aldehyde ferredoxin oxidoreductase N-terminal domain-containing protein [Thermodesulfobacteriota bacterium]
MNQVKRNRYLYIDLSSERYEQREIDIEVGGNYPSGVAFATYLLKSILPVGTDPLSPDSVVALAPGMLGGMPYPGATRMGVAFKSPLTGFWSGGTSGGQFAWALCQTDWDAVVIQGKASKLSYLLLDEGRVFFRSAEKMEGYSCSGCLEELKQTWGEGAEILCIGPAGESLVRFATLEDGSGEENLRGGLGAVFGAKGLKALVVRPFKPVKIEKTEEFLETALPLINDLAEVDPGRTPKTDPLEILKCLNLQFALPARNFQAANFSEEWFNDLSKINRRRKSCPGCPIGCIDIVADDGVAPGPQTFFPIPFNGQYLWALGPLLDVGAVDESFAALQGCLEYGMDPVSFGIVAAWAAECREKNIDLGVGEDFEAGFGDGSWLDALPQKICEVPEVQKLLSQGVWGAAKKIGSGSETFAMHYGGQELSFLDPRRGLLPLSFLGPAVRFAYQDDDFSSETCSEENWVLKTIERENQWGLMESIGICTSVGMVPENFSENLALFYELSSGNHVSGGFIDGLGKKCMDLIQTFNWREGWRSQNWSFPKRFFEEALPAPEQSYAALDDEIWRKRMVDYFLERGWTREGQPEDI